jgi:hypothetical protein
VSRVGSFGQVISRLLDGYNYVIKRDREQNLNAPILSKGTTAVAPSSVDLYSTSKAIAVSPDVNDLAQPVTGGFGSG